MVFPSVREITGGALPRLSDVKLIPDHSEDAPVGDVTAATLSINCAICPLCALRPPADRAGRKVVRARRAASGARARRENLRRRRVHGRLIRGSTVVTIGLSVPMPRAE